MCFGNQPPVTIFPCGYWSFLASLLCPPSGPGKTLTVSIFKYAHTHSCRVAGILKCQLSHPPFRAWIGGPVAEEETSVALRHRKSLSLPSSQKHGFIKVSEAGLFRFASSWTVGEVGQDLQTCFPPGTVAPGSGVAAVLFAFGFGLLSQRLLACAFCVCWWEGDAEPLHGSEALIGLNFSPQEIVSPLVCKVRA